MLCSQFAPAFSRREQETDELKQETLDNGRRTINSRLIFSKLFVNMLTPNTGNGVINLYPPIYIYIYTVYIK